jgi:hypothetical protein
VAFDPARTAVAFGDDLVLALELRGGLLEGLFAEQLALAVLVAQGEIPVLREFLGELKTVVLGADAAIATGEIGRTLPVAAVRSPVDVDLTTENLVCRHGRGTSAEMRQTV